jgi:hypothetical protein
MYLSGFAENIKVRKVKLSLCLIKHYAMKTYGDLRYKKQNHPCNRPWRPIGL